MPDRWLLIPGSTDWSDERNWTAVGSTGCRWWWRFLRPVAWWRNWRRRAKARSAHYKEARGDT